MRWLAVIVLVTGGAFYAWGWKTSAAGEACFVSVNCTDGLACVEKVCAAAMAQQEQPRLQRRFGPQPMQTRPPQHGATAVDPSGAVRNQLQQNLQMGR